MVGHLAPVSEEPVAEESSEKKPRKKKSRPLRYLSLQKLFNKRPKDGDLKILLSVLGCPLSATEVPTKASSDDNSHRVSSKAEYILRQFRATAGIGVEGSGRSIYACGKVKMWREFEGVCYQGCFVLWQMSPAMWLMELVVSGLKVAAGCSGQVAWRRTPWLRAHTAPGAARPLRRFLQGLDPILVAASFSGGEFAGEEEVEGEECFLLKVEANEDTLSQRSNASMKFIKHETLGYFSQKSGLLVCLEDSQITRIRQQGLKSEDWETVMRSYMGDYRLVEGVMVAHEGRSGVRMSRVGEMEREVVCEMEEAWVIDDVAFDVRGLSSESFILPEEINGS